MIAELGHFALALALPVALIQMLVPLAGAARRNPAWMAVGPPAALVQLALVAAAFAALTHAFVTSDFSVINVFQNSHTDKPMLYKVSGVWGNHEGSMVLWVLILALFGAAVALFGRNLPATLRARVIAIQGATGLGFLAFILFTSNPFLRIDPAPPQGRGLNPLLQDPGLAFHPPMLYLGYVGFSMAFAFAVAALIEGRVDAAWARWVRPWTLAAWTFLTLGIGLGSWWAYYELGWGGWWFWDPVENASFIPWLTGTALLHSAIVVEKRETLKSWTILLAIVTFSLSLLGTFLVRSGILTSVHAFATDPTRGVFVLILLAIAVGGSFTLYAVRAPTLDGGGVFAPVSREGGLLINNLLLATAAGTVLLGTLYPLIAEALGLGKLSVGPPYFNAVFVPLMVPLAALTAVGPFLAWKRADAGGIVQRLKFVLAAALLMVGAVWLGAGGSLRDLAAAGGMGLATWLGLATLVEWGSRVRGPGGATFTWTKAWARAASLPRSAYGMTLAHFGLAVLIAGVTGATAWKQERIESLAPGESLEAGGYKFTFDGARTIAGPNYDAIEGTYTVTKDNRIVAVLTPERRSFTQPPQVTTEAAIHTTFVTDLYAVIGDPDGETGKFVARIYIEPFVPCIWYGVLLMGLGGIVSLSDRRYRIGAPRRVALPAGAVPAE
ncbi:MAG: heme lyase CcmF/NrfE family subunit [Rhodospirillaceae bacterium]|nr:heme lyase CcmF/NrfE family subunit [Rhodospirillaceae bacterium]